MLDLIKYSHSDNKHRFNIYRCSYCNSEKVIRQRNPMHRSCGCQMKVRKHGHEIGRRKTPELQCYRKIISRCEAKYDKSYKDYGGRGIKVCHEWRLDFLTFLRDMGPRPSPKHSIERIDVNGDYEPKNCIWATKYEQSRNTRTNVKVTYKKETLIIHDWFKIYGLSKTQYYRYIHEGFNPKAAIVKLLKQKRVA